MTATDRTFTIITALTLSLGAALDATVFSGVNAVLLEPPPYERPGELVTVGNLPPNGEIGQVGMAELLDYRRISRTVADLAFTGVQRERHRR